MRLQATYTADAPVQRLLSLVRHISDDVPASDVDEEDGLKCCLDVNDVDNLHHVNGDLHHLNGDAL